MNTIAPVQLKSVGNQYTPTKNKPNSPVQFSGRATGTVITATGFLAFLVSMIGMQFSSQNEPLKKPFQNPTVSQTAKADHFKPERDENPSSHDNEVRELVRDWAVNHTAQEIQQPLALQSLKDALHTQSVRRIVRNWAANHTAEELNAPEALQVLNQALRENTR